MTQLSRYQVQCIKLATFNIVMSKLKKRAGKSMEQLTNFVWPYVEVPLDMDSLDLINFISFPVVKKQL